jgi:hypothetical protein
MFTFYIHHVSAYYFFADRFYQVASFHTLYPPRFILFSFFFLADRVLPRQLGVCYVHDSSYFISTTFQLVFSFFFSLADRGRAIVTSF